jgi:hypothetical protein
MKMAAVVEGVKMKRCPFCGSAANLKTDPGYNRPHFWAKCSNRACGISTMATEDQDSAAALWNGRSN